jgi:hypothetical protein
VAEKEHPVAAAVDGRVVMGTFKIAKPSEEALATVLLIKAEPKTMPERQNSK